MQSTMRFRTPDEALADNIWRRDVDEDPVDNSGEDDSGDE